MRRRSHFEVFIVGNLVTIFLFCCIAEGAKWYKVGETKEGAQTFVETNSIKRIGGNIVKAWTRELPSKPQAVGDEKLIEITSYNEFKCGHNQFRPSEVVYSYQSGKTERITSAGMKSWKTIARESIKIMYEYLCNERMLP